VIRLFPAFRERVASPAALPENATMPLSALALALFTLAPISQEIPPETLEAVREAVFGAEAPIGYRAEDLEWRRAPGRLPAFDGWAADVFGFEKAARELGEELAGTEEADSLFHIASNGGGFIYMEHVGDSPGIRGFPDPELPESIVAPIDLFFVGVRIVTDDWRWHAPHFPKGDEALSSRALHYFAGGADESTRGLLADVKRGNIDQAARFFLSSVESLAASIESISVTEEWEGTEFETPCGKVILAGRGDDHHEGGDYLLLIDFGGNDTYAPGNACGRNETPLCAVIDLGGNDIYASGRSLAEAGAGAGIGGIGVLLDVEGDDRYQVTGYGAGFAACGAGILIDRAGDDRYVGDTFTQAVGFLGVGLLLDEAGDDYYELFTFGQGLGLPMGTGLLCDRRGNDEYVARDDELRSPSPQSAEHNVSLAQGCGYAFRTEEDRSSSGGLGILLDQEGDDRYRGAVFAQAIGYWFGVGMLFDLAGNDEYEAVYYGQSASAHFALSYLRDVSGDDHYRTSLSQSLGNGRDLSISIFRDDTGDDHYFAPDRSLGCGDVAGCGLFADLAGRDENELGATTNGGFASYPGAGDDRRRRLPTVGIFLDLGGATDLYGDDRIVNGDKWNRKGKFPRMRGIGIDDGEAPR